MIAKRVKQFFGAMWRSPKLWLRSPVVWHNVRALWLQSDPNLTTKWWERLNAERAAMTPEEREAYDRETELFLRAARGDV
jgi:hypothetical protein